MNHKLSALARRMNLTPEKIPAPAPESGLGAQIEQLIAQAVEERVSSALDERQQPAHVQRLLDRQFKPPMPTDYRELPVTPKTAPAKNQTMLIHRDAAGAIAWAECGGMKFKTVRDGTGRIIAIEPVDESPVLPALDVPYKASAREYNPGTPR
jgi:hypothetical protein